MNIVNATFVSVWDGDIHLSSNCKVNMETREIFDIEMHTDVDGLDCLDAEYVEIDGQQYPAYPKWGIEEDDNDCFWYNM